MFSRILLYALVGLLVVIVLHFLLSLIGRQAARARTKWTYWEILVYLGVLGSVAVLGTTAFYAVLKFGSMHGWILFAHMFGAGAFVAVLPVVALTWCEANRLTAGPEAGSLTDPGPAPRFFWFPKLMFWLLVTGGFVVTMTMLLSMLPLFGTEELEELLEIHRYSGLVVVVAVALHLYCVLLQRLRWR